MSKKQRLRKEVRSVQTSQEREAIITRRNDRLAPMYAEVKRFSITLVSTIILLIIGVTVNNHLPQIANYLRTPK